MKTDLTVPPTIISCLNIVDQAQDVIGCTHKKGTISGSGLFKPEGITYL